MIFTDTGTMKNGKSKKGAQKTSLERRYQRASCDFPADFVWGTINHNARIKVLSIGGCFLAGDVIVPPQEEVELSFNMGPGSKRVKCRGKVVWISEKGVPVSGDEKYKGFAVEFKRMYPEDRAIIDDYVKKQNRIFKTINHELNKSKPDKALIKELFARVYPEDSTHLNHIKKVVREELRYFRLRR